MGSYGHWNTSIVGEFDPTQYFGFVYLIENTVTQQKYIGRKQFYSKIRKKITGQKNRKITFKESDWQTYSSSSVELNELIGGQGKDKFIFSILKLCKTKRDLGYGEVSEQFKRDVLYSILPNGEREYYNRNIMSRWFVNEGGYTLTESTKQKMQESALELYEDVRKKISEAKRGKPSKKLGKKYGKHVYENGRKD